jgi:esterase/lipase superfamily enzyme
LICGEVHLARDSVREVGKSYNVAKIAVDSAKFVSGRSQCVDYVLSQIRGASHALVLVHGYDNSFSDVVSRVAGFVEDINYEAPIIIWSWPSQGWIGGYKKDEAASKWTTRHFIEYFRALKSSGVKLDFLAHSMGSRILMQLLFVTKEKVASSSTFAAADADREEFKTQVSPDGVQQVRASASFNTLYTSEYDGALWMSKLYHRHNPRAGWGGKGILTIPGMDSIDVNISGHSYLFDHPYPLQDFETLIKTQTHASGRGLIRESGGSGEYYVINP